MNLMVMSKTMNRTNSALSARPVQSIAFGVAAAPGAATD